MDSKNNWLRKLVSIRGRLLWGAVIGRPAVLKTPAIQELLKPIKRLEVAAQQAFESAEREFIATRQYGHSKALDQEFGEPDEAGEVRRLFSQISWPPSGIV